MSHNYIHINDTEDFDLNKVYGQVGWRVRDVNGNVIQDYDGNNNIVRGIRAPIIKLLGAFQNIKVEYSLDNGASWSAMPSSNRLENVHGNIDFRLDLGSMPYIAKIAFGSNSTPPTIYDTALVEPITASEKLLSASPIFSTNYLQATFAVLYGLNELEGITMREAGLFTVDGTLVARALIGEYTKISGVYFEFYWTIGYSG